MSGTGSGGAGRFSTTRWSLILASIDSQATEGKGREALAQLCRIYWRPIFAYVCRRGHSVADAEDLTQDFFLRVLKNNLLEHADRDRGRFRTLLLSALQNFLHDAHEKQLSERRGGAVRFVSWDDWVAEAPSLLSLPASAYEAWPAEKIFDVRWAATLAEQALRQLQEECESRGRRRVFDALSKTLTANRDEINYANLSRELRVGEAQIKRLLHQLRLRFRQLLRRAVAETMADPTGIDEELRYLCSALAIGQESDGG